MSGAGPLEHTQFDESHWPIVVATIPPQGIHGATFDEHCRKTFSYFERRQSFALVFDARSGPPLTAEQRRIIAELTDKSVTEHPTIKFYVAVIVANAVQRGIVKAINWLVQQPVPTEVFGRVEDGVAWASKKLAHPAAAESASQR